MPAARRTVDIRCPPDRVMAVLVDFPSYPSFLADMERVEVLAEAPDEWEVRFQLRMIRLLTYTLRLRRAGDRALRWSLVAGEFRSNEGGWELEPIEDGACTRATYAIDLQLETLLPGNIVHSLVELSLPETLRRFKDEAERREVALPPAP